MSQAQSGIFEENTNQFYYLEYKLDFSMDLVVLKQAIKSAVRNEGIGINVVVAFGKKAWNLIQPNWQPVDLVDFKTLNGVQDFSMPSTQGDLFFWIHSNQHDDNFDQVLLIQSALEKVAKIQLDLVGFNYHNQRDLIGFVDGTANPKEDARQMAALIPEGEVGAGGSYVLSQKWVHDLSAFKQLTIAEQEKVVGRTKVEDIELTGDDMPVNSHVSRTDISVDGQAMKIYRRSDPFGSATEHGLYFLAFACEMRRFSIQLEHMLGMTDDGIHDKLIEYSKAVTGSYWFAPSIEDLQSALT